VAAAGQQALRRVCVGRASSTIRPVTYNAIRIMVVGLPRRHRRHLRREPCVLATAMLLLWRLFYSALRPTLTA
jgi:hypothetical protein